MRFSHVLFGYWLSCFMDRLWAHFSFAGRVIFHVASLVKRHYAKWAVETYDDDDVVWRRCFWWWWFLEEFEAWGVWYYCMFQVWGCPKVEFQLLWYSQVSSFFTITNIIRGVTIICNTSSPRRVPCHVPRSTVRVCSFSCRLPCCIMLPSPALRSLLFGAGQGITPACSQCQLSVIMRMQISIGHYLQQHRPSPSGVPSAMMKYLVFLFKFNFRPWAVLAAICMP